jgi:MtaA/CmuA family methyltransferase
MNSFERYLAVVKKEPADILPRLPILMAFAAEFIDSYYGAFASDYRVLVEANLRCCEAFEFDQVSAISDPYRETQGFGAEILYPRDSVPRCVVPPLEQDRRLSLLKQPDPRRSERMLDRVRAVEEFRRHVHGRASILGWIEGPAAEAADLRGVTNFLMDLVLDPPYACELMDRCVEVGIAFGRAQIEAGADTVGVGDAIASQMSAEMYEEFVFPREKRLFEGIHAAGGLVRLHICGDTTHLLPAFARVGADIVDLDWQVDMAAARAALGRGIVLVGNLDPVSAVQRSTPERIRQAVAEAYQTVGNPYMVGAGCEIPPGTAPENLRALCSPVRSR